MTSVARTPKSSSYIERKLMEYARSADGLTWRKVHDTFSRDDRIRARDVFDRLTRERGPLHVRKHGRACWYFASSAQASAWQPPVFNEHPTHGLGTHVQRRPSAHRGKEPPQLPGSPARHGDAPPAGNGGPRYTVCPAPRWDSRYQIDPETRVVGGFRTLGMGRYLDERDSSNP